MAVTELLPRLTLSIMKYRTRILSNDALCQKRLGYCTRLYLYLYPHLSLISRPMLAHMCRKGH